MYKKIAFFLVLFCFLISCRVTRQEVKNKETKDVFTTEKIVVYKDTTIVAPSSETSLKIPIAELAFKKDLNAVSKPRIYTQKNGNATAKIKIVHDTVVITATCDSLKIVAKIKKELQKQNSTKNTITTENTKQKSGFSFWDLIISFTLGFGVCFFLKLLKIIP